MPPEYLALLVCSSGLVDCGDMPAFQVDPEYPHNLLRLENDLYKTNQRLRLSVVLAIIAVFIGTASSVMVWLSANNPTGRNVSDEIYHLRSMVGYLADQNREVDRLVSDLNTKLKAGTRDQDVAVLAERIETLQTRIVGVQEAISADPLKAVSLPLIRKDVESLQERHRADVALLREDAGRVYTFAQWAIGIMITGLIGMVGLGLNLFRQSKPEPKQDDPAKEIEKAK